MVLCAIRTIKHTNLKIWSKLGNLLLPLVHYGLWDYDERPHLGVGDHGCDELDSLSETHLIAKETTLGTFWCEFATEEPFDPFALVRGDETTLERSHFFLASADLVLTYGTSRHVFLTDLFGLLAFFL